MRWLSAPFERELAAEAEVIGREGAEFGVWGCGWRPPRPGRASVQGWLGCRPAWGCGATLQQWRSPGVKMAAGERIVG